MARKFMQTSWVRTLLALVFLTAASAVWAESAQLVAPKTAKAHEKIELSISNPENLIDLEVTITSRSLPESKIIRVPSTGLVVLDDLPAGHYILGLRKMGLRKYLDTSAMTVTEVLK